MSARDTAALAAASARSARAEELNQLREAADERAALQATNVVEAAVKETLGEQFALEAKIEWRRGSGAAHGLPWSLLGISTTTQVGSSNGDGMAEFHAVGGWQAVANGYMAGYHLLRRGWALMDQRGRATS